MKIKFIIVMIIIAIINTYTCLPVLQAASTTYEQTNLSASQINSQIKKEISKHTGIPSDKIKLSINNNKVSAAISLNGYKYNARIEERAESFPLLYLTDLQTKKTSTLEYVNYFDMDNKEISYFLDLNTKEQYHVNYSEANLQVAPLVWLVGAIAVKYTVKKVGKKVIMKIGKRTFYQKSSKAVSKALVNFKPATVNVGSKKVTLSKASMQHILKNHHPNYWTGGKKTMIDPSLSINQIKSIILKGIRDNKTSINKAVKSGKSINVYTTSGKVKYKISINSSGKISSFHPN